MTELEVKGIGYELKFWKWFVNSPHFIHEWLSDKPNIELTAEQSEVAAKILSLGTGAKILDVGSGVVSVLRGLVPEKNVCKVDPLGELYECIFNYAEHNITPPLPIPAEELHYTEQFDCVHMRNALDHAQDPVKALDNLWNAVKPGGWLIVHGFENEGTYEKWSGFHQYNITVKGNAIMVENKKKDCICLMQGSAGLVKKLSTGKMWFIWMKQKQS